MTTRAKLSYDERVFIEDSLNRGMDRLYICGELCINSVQLELEIRRGWIKTEKKYSAEKAQFSLR